MYCPSWHSFSVPWLFCAQPYYHLSTQVSYGQMQMQFAYTWLKSPLRGSYMLILYISHVRIVALLLIIAIGKDEWSEMMCLIHLPYYPMLLYTCVQTHIQRRAPGSDGVCPYQMITFLKYFEPLKGTSFDYRLLQWSTLLPSMEFMAAS
jgi:hypothetical protein